MSTHDSNKHPEDVAKVALLTKRELDVIRLISEGLSNREIADQLQLMRGTVSNYISRILEKLDLRDRVGLAIYANRYILKQDPVSNSVVTQFEFPESVKVACEQYLLYFVEFLKDIGIDVTADLQEDAGQVLFSVTPRDKDEALDNIREALEIYLRLPLNRNTAIVVSPETSIEVQKLSAQLGLLQMQFQLANATIQQKEIAIQQRDTVIYHQQNLLNAGQVFIEALQEEVKPADTEPVIGSVVKVKKADWDGVPIEVDLPTIVRWMKKKFGRKRLPGK
jgi:DNA-binding CsgD family transcriptional regulator